MVDAYQRQRKAQAKYRHKRRGITAKPVASLLRDFSFATGRYSFGALVLRPAHNGLLLMVDELCRDVDEQTAREAIATWQNGNSNTQTTL